MGKLFDAAKKHSYSKATFCIGEEKIELLVKLFGANEYDKQLGTFQAGDNKKAAEVLSSYFLDPDTLKPALTAEELLSDEWKNADSLRLFQLFLDVNLGKEGN